MCLLHFNTILNILGNVFCSLVPEFPEMRHSRIIIPSKMNSLTSRLRVDLIKAAAHRPIICSQINFINLIYSPHPTGSYSSIELNAPHNPVLAEFIPCHIYNISEKERANFATQSLLDKSSSISANHSLSVHRLLAVQSALIIPN